MSTSIKLSPAEAAVALAVIVSFADDDPSPAEGVVLRRYYHHSTAEQLQAKLDKAGIEYPGELSSIEPAVLESLRTSPAEFRTRTIAVGWLLAEADGVLQGEEVGKLAACAEALGVSLSEARSLASAGIPEVDEMHDETAAVVSQNQRELPELPVTEAAAALAAWVGFSDDEPSDAEAAVVREHFSRDVIENLQAQMADTGLKWPGDLPELEPAILRSLRAFAREEQLRALAIARKVALADGTESPDETEIVARFCEELAIGMTEVEQFFTATPE